jgi:thioredoxin-like negative regulator of GroEL
MPLRPAHNGALDGSRPKLVFFYSPQSGRCRRVDGFLAQVLQRRRNHDTFDLYRVDHDERPDLVARLGVQRLPTLLVLSGGRIRGRLEEPRGCRDIESFLAPWLRATPARGRPQERPEPSAA